MLLPTSTVRIDTNVMGTMVWICEIFSCAWNSVYNYRDKNFNYFQVCVNLNFCYFDVQTGRFCEPDQFWNILPVLRI